MKIGRNSLCHCGSGKKFKRCHGSFDQMHLIDDAVFKLRLDQERAREDIRKRQQGLGNPIVSANIGGQRVVAVKNELHAAKTWGTFADFLSDYIKKKLGSDWGNAEIAKPFEQRHPIMQWYHEYCRYQRTYIKEEGKPTQAVVTGVVLCYMGLAYSLYLIAHNAELQERMIKRLKDVGNFQGAYYELIVANTLIRAGFELQLEDEQSRESQHCEFSAVSKATGKKYWVEAKMRGVAGFLGRTAGQDGSPDDKNYLSKMVKLINSAFRKPAGDDRIIFIDLNIELPADISTDNPPEFMPHVDRAINKIEQRGLHKDKKAYIFITNFSAHRMLDVPPPIVAMPYGFGMPELNYVGPIRLSERDKVQRKHADAHAIGNAFTTFGQFPSTFDGSLPSEAFYGGKNRRILIGETYDFDGTIGTVTTASVSEAEKAMYVAISTKDSQNWILKQPMTDEELREYHEYRDSYFGVPLPASRHSKSPEELFQWLLESHRQYGRDNILMRVANWPNFAHLVKLDYEDLLAEYCEVLTAQIVEMGSKPAGD